MAFPKGGYTAPKKISGNANVGSKGIPAQTSSGKLLGGSKHVALGTTHGNHSVGHAVKGASMSHGKVC